MLIDREAHPVTFSILLGLCFISQSCTHLIPGFLSGYKIHRFLPHTGLIFEKIVKMGNIPCRLYSRVSKDVQSVFQCEALWFYACCGTGELLLILQYYHLEIFQRFIRT
ncbi:uncharacterized protein EV154DRAFT_487345 [Mucor mucedo]|uniref:uncharacterized protein n=1 Tax=Mucor mucedo TaxID=29922 RepID=UPI002220DFB3|nr:uncharacterized protein EV154DRAFT_487345 [Mucor mucedo]KAI7873248.1 hypothetical protein EV154DRAFT_487345 [Mucor mucedo]